MSTPQTNPPNLSRPSFPTAATQLDPYSPNFLASLPVPSYFYLLTSHSFFNPASSTSQSWVSQIYPPHSQKGNALRLQCDHILPEETSQVAEAGVPFLSGTWEAHLPGLAARGRCLSPDRGVPAQCVPRRVSDPHLWLCSPLSSAAQCQNTNAHEGFSPGA